MDRKIFKVMFWILFAVVSIGVCFVSLSLAMGWTFGGSLGIVACVVVILTVVLVFIAALMYAYIQFMRRLDKEEMMHAQLHMLNDINKIKNTLEEMHGM